MLYVLISLFVWLFVILSTFILFPIALVIFLATFLFDKKRYILHKYSCFWASIYVWINPLWDVEIKGREKIDPKKTYLFVSNHQSLLDIILAYTLFYHFKWVSKDTLFNIPMIGWNMSLNGYIKLRRKDPKSHLNLMKAASKNIAKGSSLFMFPEGTRSPDGEIKRFKDGAFLIAKKNKVGVAPILIVGAHNAVPKKGFVMKHRQKIVLEVQDPIEAEEVASMETKEISNRVKETLISRYAEYTK